MKETTKLVGCVSSVFQIWGMGGYEHGDDVDGCSQPDGFVSEAGGGGFCLDGVVEWAYGGDVD